MATSPIATTPPDQTSQPIAVAPTTQSTKDSVLIYPENLNNKQDAIKFVSLKNVRYETELGNNSISELLPYGGKTQYTINENAPAVYLPIQPTISDQNSVNWGSGELNELQRKLVNVSLKAMGGNEIGEAAADAIKGATASLKDLKALGQLYLAEQAVGVQGLLSRYTGSVLNPNLELLFQGPQLRPFNFTFKLSPRSNSEAIIVKKIINFFKKNMAVRTVDNNLFLKAPYVFQIEYFTTNKENKFINHPSINLIKQCALQSCSVDYTPLGSYMSYDDDDHTMVSYTLNLQFQEIEPIYQRDYEEYKDHPIGF